MTTEIVEQPAGSLFERLIAHPRSPWITVGIGLALVLAPVVAAYLDGVLGELFTLGAWRTVLLPAAVIVYILALAPPMARQGDRVIEAFRPLVQMDDDSFDRLVDEASHISPLGEVIAFGLGVAFALWLGLTGQTDWDAIWLVLTLLVSSCLMWGLLAWTIYGSVAGTRVTAELHREPLQFDIFDPTAFEPIGRLSLITALAFVGGIVLSMVFNLRPENIFAWQNWLLYLFLAFVPIVVFFLSMRGTHRVLSAEKKRELEAVEEKILVACRSLMERLDAHETTGTLSAEINALIAYEERVRAARTWPYDTRMLRTLLFSVVIPGGAALARVAAEFLFADSPLLP